MDLLVNRIQRFCLHDGPGIRTTAFCQGCRLNCWWCHNPETRSFDAGEPWPIAALVAELEKDAAYWAASGGGVTLSGGEPLQQPRAAEELLVELADRGHHTAVDTCGDADLAVLQRVSPHVRLWLWDVKAVTPKRHRQATGADNQPLLANLAWVLRETGADVLVRVPLIAGMNTDEEELRALAEWLSAAPRTPAVEILPGHSHAREKGGSPAGPDPTPSEEQASRAFAILAAAGLNVRCRGMTQ